MTETTLIVGGGHAAGQTAVSLRQAKYAGHIAIIGEEPYPPYQRPPLSKKFLSGEMPLDRLLLRKESYYSDHDVRLMLNTRVARIDRDSQRVQLEDGTHLPYDRLVLATGANVRRLSQTGGDLGGIHYLRSVDDVHAIRERFVPGASLVVIGAGYIGLEVAAVARTAGLRVTVLEMAERVLARVTAPEVSTFFERIHREAGVDIRTGCAPGGAFAGDGDISMVITADGSEIAADLVLVGIGIVPATELAASAGLDCNDGIIVDEYCRTNDPNVFAVGDCTNHPNELLGRRLRLESVHNAQEQAKTAAAAISGSPEPYCQIPWFWSDQYDVKLQIVGLSGDHDNVVLRGDPGERSFAAFYLRDDRILAVDAINSAREFMLSKKLVARGVPVDVDALTDSNTSFKALAESALG